MDEDNIIKFMGKPPVKDGLPEADYAIVTMDGSEYFTTGFLVFTPHHVAIMREVEGNSIPVFVCNLNYVKVAEIIQDDGEDELPF